VDVSLTVQPRLDVLDHGLPDHDGTAVSAMLRAGPDAGALPILPFTADGRAAEKARAGGAFAYQHKPFDAAVRLVGAGLGRGDQRAAGESAPVSRVSSPRRGVC
jgi:CheY-like chemotaxis protein